LGYTQQLPTEERYLMTRQELQGKIDVLFGGRAAEQLVFGEVSTGAHNDLQRATDIAKAMVLEYGMGEALGPVVYPRQRQPMFLRQPGGFGAERGRDYSEATAQALDKETKQLLEERMAHVVRLLRSKRHLLDRLAALLVKKEVVEAEEFTPLVPQESAPHTAEYAA
jgi:cell division protease FtsH